MSNQGNVAPTLSSLLAPVGAAASLSFASSLPTVIKDFSTDVIGLAETEAEDFGNFIDNVAMEVETGSTWTEAFAKEKAKLVAEEQSQLYNLGMTLLEQGVAVIDSWLAPIKAVL